MKYVKILIKEGITIMSPLEIMSLCSIIISILFTIIFGIYFLQKIVKFKKHKNSIKNIFNTEEFNFLSKTLNENEKIKEKEKLKKNVSKYFSNLFIYDFNIKLFFNFLSTEIGKGKKSTKIAWDFFILLTTSVLSNESEGFISEATISLLSIFNKGKELLYETENPTLISDIILKILNLKIRPILVKTRKLPQIRENGIYVIEDDKVTKKQQEEFWNSINSLRKELIEDKYLRFISLAAFSNLTNKDIIKLLNYSKAHEESKNNLRIEEEINKSVEKLVESMD